jgi:dihydroorotate dehydrogenase/NAD-dependent dihydropyrimidine dehydrogenase PreA subunit
MADLDVEFAGLKLKNPFVVASASTTMNIDQLKKAEKFGASAVITKMALLETPATLARYYAIPEKNVLFVPSDKRLSIGQAEKLISQAKKETSLAIIANIMGPGENLEGWAILAKKVESAGADMVELNLSCPNIGLMARQIGVEARGHGELGAFVGQNPHLSQRVTRAVKEATSIPVMCKMTPEAGDLVEVAQACIEGGASAISAINNPQGIPGVNIYKDGIPIYPGLKTQSFGGIAGEWIRPLAFKQVALLAMKLPETPIAGGGGLTDDVVHTVEMLMLGATVTTYCTILMFKGFQVIRKLEKDLIKFMDKMGYSKISDFRGTALKYIKASYDIEYIDAVAFVDPGKCDLCGNCFKLAHCEAISKRKDAAYVDPAKCIKCSTCVFVCPIGAISMQELA